MLFAVYAQKIDIIIYIHIWCGLIILYNQLMCDGFFNLVFGINKYGVPIEEV